MTDFENLKLQIENYVRTGMQEERRQQLLAQAQGMGINAGQFVMLVKNAELELKFATGISNTEYPNDMGSGFLTAQQDTQDDQMGSGFVQDISQPVPSGDTTQHASGAAPNVGFSSNGDQFTEIKKLDASGAMADVYSALHLGRRKVIIKRIKPQYRYNKEYVDLFFKEFDNGYSLENSNIVHFYGKGEDAEGPYYYMEYVDGRTLHDFIHIEKNPKPELIRQITLQILEALKYMHQKQIYHRDLKPENIMLTYKGNNVKIIDFGLAAADSMVDSLQKAGTPRYAPPELMNNATRADQRSDIFSLGLIIIEMFTETPSRTRLPEVPVELMRKIADRCTMGNPDDRFQSCDEIIMLLQSGASNPVPKWLEDKIKEFAADGVITRNERIVLDKEIAQAGVDKVLAEAMISDAVDKAIAQKRKTEMARRGMSGQMPAVQQQSSSRHLTKRVFQILAVTAGVLLVALLLIQLRKGGGLQSSPNSGVEALAQQDFVKGEVVYATANVNLRQLADKSSKILTTLRKNTPVEVIDVGYHWVEVKVDNKRGYISKQYLSHTLTK